MQPSLIPGLCVRGKSFGDALALFGTQVRWVQPAVNTSNARLFAEQIAALADALVAAYVFKEPEPAGLTPFMSSTLWTLASTRIERAQLLHRKGVESHPEVNCDFRLKLWLLPKLGIVLGRPTPGRVTLFDQFLDVSGVESACLPSAGAVAPGLSAGQLRERLAWWEMTKEGGPSCRLEMGWEPVWPSPEQVAAHFDKVASRARRLARERAVARFCDPLRTPVVERVPEPLRAMKALQLLTQSTSGLSQSCADECSRLAAVLLPPSSLAARMDKPLTSVLARL